MKIGNYIPQKVLDKIFQPPDDPVGRGTSFTNKFTRVINHLINLIMVQTIYDIIKAHSGEVKVKTKEGEGLIFIIQLPANN